MTRRYKTYVKVRLAKVKTDATGDAEAVQSFVTVANSLLKLDPRIVIHPWGAKANYNFAKPITKNSAKPTTKENLYNYVDRIFIRENSFPYVRMLTSHDVHRTELSSETFTTNIRDQGINLWIDAIQAETIKTAGWLLGSHPEILNTKDFATILQQHPLLKGVELEVQVKFIRPTTKYK